MIRALTDERLAGLAQGGDRDATDELMRRYEGAVAGEASQFFLTGGDRDDTLQEARIGLLRAVEAFDPERGVPFGQYARLSIHRQLITAVKAANRMKHGLLSGSLREGLNEDGEPFAIVDLLAAPHTDAQERLERRAELRRIARALRVSLSVVEARCLILWANGESYADIQERVGLDTWKAVDRAITRARWKLLGQGPPSNPDRPAPTRTIYVCPGCGHETVRVTDKGFARKGAGRPPFCNVCTTRKAAA